MCFLRVPSVLQRGTVILAITLSLTACDSRSLPAANTVAAAPAAVPSPAASAMPVSMVDSCASAFSQLQQCHRKLAASGRAGAAQLDRSATYLRRLQAWWEMDRNNPAIQNSCRAIAAGEMECEPEADGDEAESAEEFKVLMEKFDAAGVPK